MPSETLGSKSASCLFIDRIVYTYFTFCNQLSDIFFVCGVKEERDGEDRAASEKERAEEGR